MADRRLSVEAPISAAEARAAVTEGYVEYIDPTESDVSDKNKRILMSELAQLYKKFSSLSGTVWDGSNKVLTLNANKTLTFTPGSNQLGVLVLVQDATGGRTVTINGNSVAVNAAASSRTVISAFFIEVLNEYLFFVSNPGLSVAGAGDTTAPTIVSASVTDATHIQIIFSESVTVTTAGWSFKKNGSALAITSVSGSGTTWTFLVATISAGDTILRSYNSTMGNTIDVASNELVSFTDQAVTNSLGDVTPPVRVSIVVEDATPNKIRITYNESLLGSSVPANTDYILNEASPGSGFTGTPVVGSNYVDLTLSTPMANGDVWDLGYTGTAVKDLAGNSAAGFSTILITNNVLGGGSGDPDAAAFIAYAIGKGDTLDSTDQGALDQLFVDLKAASIAMTDIIALYPSAGTTLAHKGRNAMSPFDGTSVETKHLVWTGTGSPAVDAAGITPNGSDHKGDTSITALTFPTNNIYLFYYSLDAAAGAAAGERFDMGGKDTNTSWIALACRHPGDITYGVAYSASSGLLQVANTDGLGFYAVGIDPTGPANFLQKNGTIIDTDTPAGSAPTASISLGLCAGTTDYSARKFGPAGVIKNMTPTKALALRTAIQAYMTTRGHAV